MKLILLSALLFLFSNAFSQKDTLVKPVEWELNLTKGYYGPFKSFRKNGTLKSEFYDNYNGNRIFYYYTKSEKLKRMEFLFDVKWARSSLPPCLYDAN